MMGLGYRREMAEWDLSALDVGLFEVAPENWLRRDRSRLHAMRAMGLELALHGVSLNLGGQAPLDLDFVRDVKDLADELGVRVYSDHLAASGDAHQLYDLFPVPFTRQEARRIAERIARVQDVLGARMAVENATWYTNIGDLSELEFVQDVVSRADCLLLFDVNNVAVNYKNHGGHTPVAFARQLDGGRVAYLHVAGHEFDARFGLHIDTHSTPVESGTAQLAQDLAQQWGVPLLLEWDHDVPSLPRLQEELLCLQPSLIT